jgi:hypothetical protein
MPEWPAKLDYRTFINTQNVWPNLSSKGQSKQWIIWMHVSCSNMYPIFFFSVENNMYQILIITTDGHCYCACHSVSEGASSVELTTQQHHQHSSYHIAQPKCVNTWQPTKYCSSEMEQATRAKHHFANGLANLKSRNIDVRVGENKEKTTRNCLVSIQLYRITSHSQKKPDGYCRDLSLAAGNKTFLYVQQ